MNIPCGYDSIFKKVLFLTGVGRSGTTILGKLIGSMSPVYYLFEPAAMKYLGSVQGDMPDILKGILFEDYFLPQICGRNTNYNQNDWTYSGNIFTQSEIEQRWSLNRRSRAVDFIKKESPLYCIKNPELQPIIENVKTAFPDCVIFNIIRNGFDVISSSIERGWYTDSYMSSSIIDWVEDKGGVCVPFYLTEEDQENWLKYDQVTRCALVWRVLIEYGFEYGVENICYEDFCENPSAIVDKVESLFAVRRTELTEKHLDSIAQWKKEKNPEVTSDMIMEPERSRFLSLMYEIGYAE